MAPSGRHYCNEAMSDASISDYSAVCGFAVRTRRGGRCLDRPTRLSYYILPYRSMIYLQRSELLFKGPHWKCWDVLRRHEDCPIIIVPWSTPRSALMPIFNHPQALQRIACPTECRVL